MNIPTTSADDLRAHLHALGVRTGDHLTVHPLLLSFGYNPSIESAAGAILASRVPVNTVQSDTALFVFCEADLAKRHAIGAAPAGPKFRHTPCKRSGAGFPRG
jgi:hypothetical protein